MRPDLIFRLVHSRTDRESGERTVLESALLPEGIRIWREKILVIDPIEGTPEHFGRTIKHEAYWITGGQRCRTIEQALEPQPATT